MSVASSKISSHRHDHLAKLGQRLSLVAHIMIVPLALIPIVRWWLPNGVLLMPVPLVQGIDSAHLLWVQRLAGTLVDAVITGIGIAALLALARFGEHFSAGKGLSANAARLQLVLGRRLLWLAGAQLIYTPVVTLAVTLFNPPGHRLLAITITGNEVILLVAALVIFLFSRIMEEAARIAEENAQII